MRYKNTDEYLERYRQDKSCFGGSIPKGNPRGQRPFFAHQALHLVMRSSLSTGPRTFLRGDRQWRIKAIIRKQAARFDVRLYRLSINGNHLHILVKPSRQREGFIAFLRAISGLIARAMLGAERGAAKGTKFWDKRPFSRIVAWGKAFERCAKYIERNIFEAFGFEGLEIAAKERRNWRSS